MSKAIGIRAVKPSERFDEGASKFFGIPTVPAAWVDDFYDDEIFFCQIHLADIAALDPQGRLPHTGYLYVFLHTENGNRALGADVRYYDGEPTHALDDFNAAVEGYEQYNDAYLMEFYLTEEDAVSTRLFGVPSDWNYADAPGELLMQYDPLDDDMGFLEELDGFVYFFFGEKKEDLSSVTVWEEYT